MTRVGLEPTSKTPEKQGFNDQSGTESGTLLDAASLESLAIALLQLSSEDRDRLAALLVSHQAKGSAGTK